MRLQSALKKTIVFITHDFDEAIRLADRIAIMKDGEIVQTGTPEDIVLNPATPYVAEFTRGVAEGQGCAASARIMRSPLNGRPATSGAAVPPRASVADAAPLLCQRRRDCCVSRTAIGHDRSARCTATTSSP